MRFARLLILVATIGTLAPVFGQVPHEPWRTLETEHFRVHYPLALEAWALRRAGRLEAVLAAVETEVGYGFEGRADLLVQDPIARPNGMVLALLERPRMLLYATSPEPDSRIGHFHDWPELLLTHESVHLVHLARRSRVPRLDLLPPALIGPLTRKSPRWLTEGFATYLEGELTGSGRPYGDLRAAILRTWAAAGRMPSYGALSGDRRRWQGGAMAYLAGSAFVEWLVEREGRACLPALWTRMSARERRSFEEAFVGVFGEAPAALYGRFVAELSHDALELEARLDGKTHAGQAWQAWTWSTGAPALSPDGNTLAVVLRSREHPPRLALFDTGPNVDAEERWRAARERLLERDPDDVPAVRRRPLAREPLRVIETCDGLRPRSPRFSPGGDELVFVARTPGHDGRRHDDLFLAPVEGGPPRRLTRGANLHDPDFFPDGTLVAVRRRAGAVQLVRVARDGTVSPLMAPSLDVMWDDPRVAPDGRHIAALRHREGAWELVLLDADGRALRIVHRAEGRLLAHPSWAPDGSALYASVGNAGLIEVRRFPLESEGAGEVVARSASGLLAPTPLPSEPALFALGLTVDGFELRHIDLPAAPLEAVSLPRELTPVVPRSDRAPAAPPAAEPLPPGRRYGAGRGEWRALGELNLAPSGFGWGAGARVGDVVGRWDVVALAVGGDEGAPRGASVAAAWRGWPVELGIHAYSMERRPNEQADVARFEVEPLARDEEGLVLDARWSRQSERWRIGVESGALFENAELAGSDVTLSRRAFWLGGDLAGSRRRGRVGLGFELGARQAFGRSDGEDWTLGAANARLWAGFDDKRLAVSWARRAVDDALHPLDALRLGGSARSALPRVAELQRIAAPALPEWLLRGTRHESWRAELLGVLFYERHEMWTPGESSRERVSLTGARYRFRLAPFPLVTLPGLEAELGAALVLDGPLEDETRVWATMVWRP